MAPLPDEKPKAAEKKPRRLCYFNLGFARQRQVRRIMELAGYPLSLGLPGPKDGVAVWGKSPYAHRGEAIANRRNRPLFRIEDAFLRSIRPGRQGDAPIGLMIDPIGVHFDGSSPSRLEQILQTDDLDDSNLLARAKAGIARLIECDLSKYNIHDGSIPAPRPGYVLIIDQSKDDASLLASRANSATFHQMVADARAEYPHLPILIKSHPETQLGLRAGSFGTAPQVENVEVYNLPCSPWALLQGAVSVYTVSSQMGFEAILAGHRPKVYGTPFYAGWGLTEDRGEPVNRRTKRLTKAQLFAGAMLLAPTWYDPCRDRLCSFEEAVDQLEAEVKAFRQDRNGHTAVGMRLWKRAHLQKFFGREKPLVFAKSEKGLTESTSVLAWASKAKEGSPVLLVEDGFLRSKGLGAQLVPPLSLVVDRSGIYYDPSRESDLDRLILAPLSPDKQLRAEKLRDTLIAHGLSKYNLGGSLPDLPKGRRILVPGQVEDDASILCGAREVRTNLDLIKATRDANPDAIIVYKPHPDVEAGLRPGAIDQSLLTDLVDVVANNADPVALIPACDEVWTITSLLGFEALLRGKPVTCLGTPFYAGWGLTRDLSPVPEWRKRAKDGHPLPRPSLTQLIYATLIAYPRYYDPITDRPCPPEVAADRLAKGEVYKRSPTNKALAKLQGVFASFAHYWR